MLALETGWTPDILRELPTGFRSRCHWTLYVRAIAGTDGLPSIEIPHSAPPAIRMEAMKAQVQLAEIRTLLFPEDADV